MNSYNISLILAVFIYNIFIVPFVILYGLHSISESIPITYGTYIGAFLVYGCFKGWFSFYIKFKKIK